MKASLRLLTIICYFLPFAFFFRSCDYCGHFEICYNQKDADSVILLMSKSCRTETKKKTDSLDNNSLVSTLPDTTFKKTQKDTIPKMERDNQNAKNIMDHSRFWDNIDIYILTPTETSISAFGSLVLFKNLLGQIMVGLSLFLSLIIPIPLGFLKRRRTKIYLLISVATSLFILLIDSWVSQVSLLWGFWCLFLLVLLQLWVEIRGTTAFIGKNS